MACRNRKARTFRLRETGAGQYQIADEDEDADDEKPVRIIREYARMHAAAHYENTNRKFRDEMLEDIVRNKATDEALESGGRPPFIAAVPGVSNWIFQLWWFEFER